MAQLSSRLRREKNLASMRKRHLLSVALLAMARHASAQIPRRLTLADAEQAALKNHPRIGSANLNAQAAKSIVTEAKSALYPFMAGNFTSVGAEHNATLAAGTIQTSSLYSRVAAGVTISQLITDFGRTADLVESAKLRASAQEQAAGSVRAAILLQVDQAYFQALAADTVLKVAQAVVENRRLNLRQVRALAQSSLKSTLDVSFAEVAASDAELGLFRAENDAQSARARLAAAMGMSAAEQFELVDEGLPAAPDSSLDGLIADAMKNRPDLQALQLSRDASQRFARAERDLSRPAISGMAVAGGLPATDPRLRGTYGAAGINVAVPILNGKLFAARRTEAELRAQAAQKDVEDLAITIAEQVRIAWLDANTAFRRLGVTARLVAQAEQSLRLAQTRYENGLGSIVELNQAELSQVSAEITAAAAKYEYLGRRAALSFAIGALR